MRKALTAATLVALTVGLVAVSPPASAADYTTTNIGSEQWWDANIPYRAAKTKKVKGQKVRYCPKGSGLEFAGARRVQTENGARITNNSNTSRKYVRLPWVNGKKKRVKRGAAVCRLFVKPLQPSSVEQLSTWTFAPKDDRYGLVPVRKPPLDTCTPAELPTRIQPQLISATLMEIDKPLVYEYPEGTTKTDSLVSGTTVAGIYNVRWVLTAGQGTYRYPTWIPNKNGIIRETWQTTVLDPEGQTIVDVTLPLMPQPLGGGAYQTSGVSVGGVFPLCGENYLPAGQVFWSDGGPSGQVSIEGQLGAGGDRNHPTLILFNSNVPTD